MYNVNRIWKNYFFLKVCFIEEEEYEGDVYNFEVEGDESYSVGFIVYNLVGINFFVFCVIICDMKRYVNFGWIDIFVLEIQQMMGRVGRLKYDKVGEVIIVVRIEDFKKLIDRYIYGKFEKFFLMLVNEQVFRSQVLVLIINFGVEDFRELVDFFLRIFYVYQRGDILLFEYKVKDIVYFFIENEFIDMDVENCFIVFFFLEGEFFSFIQIYLW